MNTFDAVLVGVLIALFFIGLVFVGRKVWSVLSGLSTGIVNLGRTTERVGGVLDGILRELAYMRSLTAPPTPDFGVAGAGAVPGAAGPTPTPLPPVAAYPAPLMDRFQVVEVPDATMDDTDRDGLEQTDEELAQMEHIEELRQRGIQVEDSDTVHEGVVANAE